MLPGFSFCLAGDWHIGVSWPSLLQSDTTTVPSIIQTQPQAHFYTDHRISLLPELTEGCCLCKGFAHAGRWRSEAAGLAKGTWRHQVISGNNRLAPRLSLWKKHSKFSNRAPTPTLETDLAFQLQDNKCNSLISWRVLKINEASPFIPRGGKVGNPSSPWENKQKQCLSPKHWTAPPLLAEEHRAETTLDWVKITFFSSLEAAWCASEMLGQPPRSFPPSHPHPAAHCGEEYWTPLIYSC